MYILRIYTSIYLYLCMGVYEDIRISVFVIKDNKNTVYRLICR